MLSSNATGELFVLASPPLPPPLPPSSSVMVPVAESPAVTVTPLGVPDTPRLTLKVSSFSTTASSVVATVKVCVSPDLPIKAMAAVFSV